MVDSEYSMDICKSVKLINGGIMRNPEILKLIPDHPKTKSWVNMQFKNYHKICS